MWQHSVWVTGGPLRLLKEKCLSESPEVEHTVLDYVSSFRERLHPACQLARVNLTRAQIEMKCRHDKKSVYRSFQPGG